MFDLLPTFQILRKLATGVSPVCILVEDSIIHVFLVCVLMFMHIVPGFYGLATYVIPFIIASQSVGGSHSILHLRSAFYGPSEDGLTSTAFATQTIGFAVSRLVEESFYTSRSPAPSLPRFICLRAEP
ncbi:hypothetical protein EXIGLDRAFT_231317 [Exidia glandulosa HHB12029]|uniref:Uncharacterized protein n=1 Tax=Exidia glandulosa HHB12029 TaxID=1314781 RepID=A0A165E5J4_EXIGL|nr:hypothetical protein EXIGLDRAFT_231317 [Exidia glandulosa HHB12029]